jgi:hypothetical protein
MFSFTVTRAVNVVMIGLAPTANFSDLRQFGSRMAHHPQIRLVLHLSE